MKAPLEKADKNNCTPLLIAVSYGCLSSIKTLLDQGANISATDKSDWTVLHLACQNNKPAILEELLKDSSGKDLLLARDRKGYRPLHIACDRGYTDCVDVSVADQSIFSVTD